MQVKVIKQALQYGHRMHGVGQTVDMAPEHARLFLKLGRVVETEQAPRKRRVYRRRDMQPEPVVETPVVETVETGITFSDTDTRVTETKPVSADIELSSTTEAE